ncbi:beta strand repeat-containing protein [Aridibaculum aurantiacum]|uniref:beta strand repeat-containing protein n=1 Tax=Aridibaculum aurantiacum TaxID=2810307 RepID=UPI001A965A7F|nr:T9SS type A sorting domain-containing protein [Aridibaculum aurantiacum]
MRKLYLTLVGVLIFWSLQAQLTGTMTIDNTLPTTGNNYNSFTDAFNALNTSGVGPGGVTFDVIADRTFTENPPVLNATGTAANQIIFRKAGAGANPKIIQASDGTLSPTFGGHGDGLVQINGGDWITFDAIDLQANGTTANPGALDYGYYITKASATDASKNVNIRNCNITLQKANTQSCGVFVSNISGTATVTVTSEGGRAENIKIFKNNISNVYHGVQVRGFAHTSSPYNFYDQNIEVGKQDSGNIISDFAGGSVTAYGIYAIQQNNLKANYNSITGGDGTTSNLYGIFLGTSANANVDFDFNTIQLNIGTTGQLTGIYLNAGTTTGTTNTQNVRNNTITNFTRGGATGVTYFIYATSNYPQNLNISNNTIGNSTFASSGAVYGMYNISNPVNTFINNNTIQNITRTSTSASAVLFGIGWNNSSATTQFSISGNTIHSLTGMGSTGIVGGITVGSQNLINIFKNKIYNITSDHASGVVNGIQIATGSITTNIYNNLIGELKTPSSSSTSADAIRGISSLTVSANSSVNLWHNTIYLDATSSGTNFYTSGIFHTTSTTATTATLNMFNNLVVNVSTPNGTGVASVLRRSSTTTTNFGDANNNLYYAGTPSANNVIYYDGTNVDQTLADYKARFPQAEGNSKTEDVSGKFLSTSGSSPLFLHIDPTQPTQIESGGIPLAGVTDDFDGQTRSTTSPDIGADEFDGIGVDLTGPAITYTQLGNTSTTSSRALTVTITDPSGVQSGANGPRLYYRKAGTATYYFDANPTVSGNTYTFTFDFAAIGGVSAGTTIEYYVAAQDQAGNGSTSPSGGSGVNPPGTTPPAAPATFEIIPALSGSYLVGVGETYANITAIATAINSRTVEITGNVVFELTNTYDGTTGETFPINFNEFQSTNPNWTVTIRPATGVTNRVTAGDPASSLTIGLINFTGGDRYLLDGRPGGTGSTNEWTLRNTRTTASIGSVIRLVDGANFNVIRNLNLESQATSATTGLIYFHTSSSADSVGNSFNTITDNFFRGRTDVANAHSVSVYSSGTAAAPNRDNSITNNTMVDFTSAGVSISATGNGPNWIITGNNMYNTITSSSTQNGILLASTTSTGVVISNNVIGGSGFDAAGTWTNSGNVVVTGINITNGLATVTNNRIANITSTNTGTTARTRGISYTGSLANSVIENNQVHDLSSSGAAVSYTAGNQAAVGIHYFPTGFQSASIKGNTIFNISIENTTALTTTNIAAGIVVTNMGGSVTQNVVYNIRNKSTGTTANQPPVAAGIYARFLSGLLTNNMISVGEGEINDVQFTGILVAGGELTNYSPMYVLHNSVYVGGNATGSNSSFAFLRGNNTTTSQLQADTLYNNIFVNMRTGGGANHFAIGNQGTEAATNWQSNYNNLYSSNPTTIGFWNATGYDFDGWKSVSGQDANSKSVPVTFANINIADLHLAGSSVGDVNLAGTPIAAVPVDFDGDPRNATSPYMGADEANVTLPVIVNYFRGVRQMNEHQLTWKVTCTSNTVFSIERSSDSRNFTSIGTIRATLADCANPFNFTDSRPLEGTNYYRLKMTDADGRATYSITIALLNKHAGFEIVGLNPSLVAGSTTYLNVTAARNTALTLSITDVNGRTVQQAVKQVPSGSALLPVDVSTLAAGIYHLTGTTTDGYKKTIRFVKQ